MTLPQIKSRSLAVFICLVFASCVGLGFLHLKSDRYPPEISLDAPKLAGRYSPVIISFSGPMGVDESSIEINAKQGGKHERLALAHKVETETGKLAVTVNLAQSSLQDGEVLFEAKARSGYNADSLFKPFSSSKSFALQADLSAPEAAPAWSPARITRGGPGLLLITANEALSDIKLAADGHNYMLMPAGPGRYAALAAFEHGAEPGPRKLGLQMADLAGNTSVMPVEAVLDNFNFRDDPIHLNDAFFQKKNREFAEYTGKKLSPVELFLYMNREVRAQSYLQLAGLCQGGESQKLWQGAFLEMPGATRRSEFADRRDYIHNGEIIDRQVHLGLDYASVAKDFIPAANSGLVRFTGYLGIHGNAVLIDHGLGLYSLYSHLSSIDVSAGERVEKAQIIGRTGATGMAGGDHLHFEILINGTSLNPDFFFDAAWLEENIDAPLARFKDGDTETYNE